MHIYIYIYICICFMNAIHLYMIHIYVIYVIYVCWLTYTLYIIYSLIWYCIYIYTFSVCVYIYIYIIYIFIIYLFIYLHVICIYIYIYIYMYTLIYKHNVMVLRCWCKKTSSGVAWRMLQHATTTIERYCPTPPQPNRPHLTPLMAIEWVAKCGVGRVKLHRSYWK